MINYLFLSLMLLIPSVLPMALYSCKHRFMIRFYMVMAADEKVRKFYISVWLIILLVFHYVYIEGTAGRLRCPAFNNTVSHSGFI